MVRRQNSNPFFCPSMLSPARMIAFAPLMASIRYLAKKAWIWINIHKSRRFGAPKTWAIPSGNRRLNRGTCTKAVQMFIGSEMWTVRYGIRLAGSTFFSQVNPTAGRSRQENWRLQWLIFQTWNLHWFCSIWHYPIKLERIDNWSVNLLTTRFCKYTKNVLKTSPNNEHINIFKKSKKASDWAAKPIC